MAASAKPKLRALVDRIPDTDREGTYRAIDKAKIETAVAEIHKGGRENIAGLIDMLVEPGTGNDIKPHYALHVIAVLVNRPGSEKARVEFARTVASRIGGKGKGVQKFLIAQLQVAGGAEVVPDLGKVLLEPALCGPAARALASIGAGAADQLRGALPKTKGASRRTIILTLAVLGDRESADTFTRALADGDREVRIAGSLGLANIADARSADALLKAADGSKGWERIKHAKACLVLAENLLAAGNKTGARRIYAHLRDTRTTAAEAYIRKAAETALAAGT